jgi:hypothetical protein
MALDQKAITQQIDQILAKCDSHSRPGEDSKVVNTLFSAIHRLAPPGSVYARNAKLYEQYLTKENVGGLPNSIIVALDPLRGILQALRDEYEAGYLQSVFELVHADIFADFLDMAGYLSEQNYKDAAAVITGSVLEAHLRKLCGKHGITVVKADGTTPKTADALNSELTAAGSYSMLDQKSVTAWLDLRNKAAHGKYSEYTQEQVTLMTLGVRDFAARHSA